MVWIDREGGQEEKRTQLRFHTEWTTVHHNWSRVKRPSPDNPRLPDKLVLGTSTKSCGRVTLGAFVLTDEVLIHFHRFEPAMQHLPARLTAFGLEFLANRADGYYYARPSAPQGTPR